MKTPLYNTKKVGICQGVFCIAEIPHDKISVAEVARLRPVVSGKHQNCCQFCYKRGEFVLYCRKLLGIFDYKVYIPGTPKRRFIFENYPVCN